MDIAHALATSAEGYARRALGAYLEEEHSDFYLFAGVALELAMKSRLARENPSFLAPSGDFKSGWLLWRSRQDSKQLPVSVRTAGGKETLERVKHLLPAFADYDAGVRELLAARNGEVHLAQSDETMIRRGLISLLRAVNALLRVDPADFWGHHHEFVETALDENAAKVRRDVQHKLSQARERFENRMNAFSPGQREAHEAIIAEGVERQSWEELLPVDCPACGSPALAEGENTVEVGEPYFDKYGEVEGVESWVEFTASNLNCSACGLQLDGGEEFEIAGLDSSWENDAVHPSDLLSYDDY